MRTLSAIVLMSLGLSASELTAQSNEFPTAMPWGAAIGLIQNVDLKVNDDVSDNCWTNAELIRSNAFLKFEQNGIYVPDYELAFINFQTPIASLNAFGFRLDNGVCAVTASFEVYHRSSDEYGGADGKEKFRFPVLVEVFDQTVLFTNSINVNDQLKDFFEAQISEFIAKGISERRSADFVRYLELYPPTDEPPMSREEWDEMIERVTSSSSD